MGRSSGCRPRLTHSSSKTFQVQQPQSLRMAPEEPPPAGRFALAPRTGHTLRKHHSRLRGTLPMGTPPFFVTSTQSEWLYPNPLAES